MIFAPAITGPTASGKTELSIRLAEKFGFEIISLDSMQIYRGMDIGTAKATEEEKSRARHHLLDIVSPRDSFSAYDYREAATAAARDIVLRGKTPLFVGGTGLYLDTLMRQDNQNEVPESSREFREAIEATIKSDEDRAALWEELYKVDPESALSIHKNNTRRVIRALEIFRTTGIPKSVFDQRSRQLGSEFDFLVITLDFHNRENLYRRIDFRVDAMVQAGLFDEVRRLYADGMLLPDTTAAQAIGYKEMLGALSGEITLDEAKEKIKLASRRYAKRQLTWFRHVSDAYRIMADREDGSPRTIDEIYSDTEKIIQTKLKLHIN